MNENNTFNAKSEWRRVEKIRKGYTNSDTFKLDELHLILTKIHIPGFLAAAATIFMGFYGLLCGLMPLTKSGPEFNNIALISFCAATILFSYHITLIVISKLKKKYAEQILKLCDEIIYNS